MNIKEIIQRLKTAMDDARGQESHFESWLTQNEGICDAIDALKELDKTEQEPVAHFGSAYINENGVHITTVLGPVAISQDAKLYTTPPPQHALMAEHWKAEYDKLKAASKPLTDEEIMDMYNEPRSDAEMLEFARAIEAAHNIKELK